MTFALAWAATKSLWGELNSSVVERLNKGLMAVWNPTNRVEGERQNRPKANDSLDTWRARHGHAVAANY
eukprot:5656136-Pyramimonas_sp.AAC.1